MPDSEPLYVALGDSTGVGVGAQRGGYPQRLLRRMHEMRPNVRLVNQCESGATAGDVLVHQLGGRILHARPVLVTLGIGINDVGLQSPEEAFALTYEEIIQRLKKLEAPVIAINIPDLTLAPVAASIPRALYDRRIVAFNRHIEASTARHGVHLVDLHTFSQRALRDGAGAFFCADGFHPSDEGYETWAELMWPAVAPHFQAAAG